MTEKQLVRAFVRAFVSILDAAKLVVTGPGYEGKPTEKCSAKVKISKKKLKRRSAKGSTETKVPDPAAPLGSVNGQE